MAELHPIISVISPFFNEENILENSIELMLRNLETLRVNFELIIVCDGATDGSLPIARALEQKHGRLKVLSYEHNRGRGYAIRTGLKVARGDYVITTEIDSSWGDDIVLRLYEAFTDHPRADIVIASPHLKGGGYKNVPFARVFLSKYGNYLIRLGLSHKITMNTGMTRGYKRECILRLPLEEEGKEMHLEIVNKALALSYKIVEIPAVIEWKDHKLAAQHSNKRKSSSNINRLIRSHLLFSLGVAPFRYIFLVSLVLGTSGLVALAIATYRLFTPELSIYWLLTGFSFIMLGLIFSGIGLLAQQNREIIMEIWRLRSEQNRPPEDNGTIK